MTTIEAAGAATGDGALSPRLHVGPTVWPAFERALARAESSATVDREAEGLAHTLAELHAVVRHRLEGGDVLADAVAWPAGTTRVLERVRRAFVEELRGGAAADSFGAVHVFSALALVQCAASSSPGSGPDGGAALDLALEVAHDIRSPLAAILFLADMLRTGRSGPVGEQQQQQLGMIYAAALGLNQLACDLIDFVRGELDIVEQEPVPFSVSDLLCGVGDLVRPMAEEKGIVLRFVLPDECARVGRPAALGRILLNLTTNAVRHTATGVVTVAIRDLQLPCVVCEVEDSGNEIPAEVMAQLFEPYRRVPERGVSAFSGSGLGLAICHRLVDALGSELRVSTREGRGARFWFELDLPCAEQMHV